MSKSNVWGFIAKIIGENPYAPFSPEFWVEVGKRSKIRDELENLVLENGVKDKSYKSARQGIIACYSGRAEFEFMGKQVIAVGYGTRGNAYAVSQHGFIEYMFA